MAVDYGDAVEKWLTARGHAPQGKASSFDSRSGGAQPLQLPEVYQAYEAIALDTGPGSRERKNQALVALLRRATPIDAKYLVKHLVKEMRIGVNELSLLDAIADASGIPSRVIRRANQVSGDVGEIARAALVEGELA